MIRKTTKNFLAVDLWVPGSISQNGIFFLGIATSFCPICSVCPPKNKITSVKSGDRGDKKSEKGDVIYGQPLMYVYLVNEYVLLYWIQSDLM